MASQDFEVVRVISECRLVDEESFEHVYWRRDGKPLAQGYYVVSWPPGARVGRFNEDAVFRGAYRRARRRSRNSQLAPPIDGSRHQPTDLPRRALGQRSASRIGDAVVAFRGIVLLQRMCDLGSVPGHD